MVSEEFLENSMYEALQMHTFLQPTHPDGKKNGAQNHWQYLWANRDTLHDPSIADPMFKGHVRGQGEPKSM